MPQTSRTIKFIPPSRFADKTGRIIGEEKLKQTNLTVYYIELDEPDSEEDRIVASLIDYISFTLDRKVIRDNFSNRLVIDNRD